MGRKIAPSDSAGKPPQRPHTKRPSRRCVDARRRSPAAQEGKHRGCLFCRRTDVEFTSREHIFPESLGNTELVLPVGVVCDRCNNEVCAALDAAICNFGPVAMMRTLNGVPSKRGKLPSFKFDNGSLEATGPSALSLNLHSAKWRTADTPRPDGRVEWAFTAQRQDMTPKRLAEVHRALIKMAVECAWVDHGEDLVLGHRFNLERNIVLHGKHHGYLVLAKHGTPSAEISLTYDLCQRTADGAPMTAILAEFWGVTLFTDTLFDKPPGQVPPDLGSTHTF